MSTADRVREVTLRLVDLLEAEGIPYFFMGGVAVPIWGIPRATYDVDLTLSVEESGLREFLAFARRSGFAVDPVFEVGFRDVVSGMQKISIEWWTEEPRRVEVDVFLVTTDYQRAAFPRRRRVKIDGREFWVVAPADLILHKLVAGRPKDFADVQNVLLVQGVPDPEYLATWARRLGVEDLLARALRDAGLSPLGEG
ncbi:MAG: hypothetical protein HY720_08460 [Planctomycetes bacterium]|nr:hypothetical protein [Planctomycetota bacterium]